MASDKETVAEIVCEMREGAISTAMLKHVEIDVLADEWADRIEAALRREVTVRSDNSAVIAELKRRLKVAEYALDKIFKLVFVDCEVAMVAKSALSAIREKGETK